MKSLIWLPQSLPVLEVDCTGHLLNWEKKFNQKTGVAPSFLLSFVQTNNILSRGFQTVCVQTDFNDNHG